MAGAHHPVCTRMLGAASMWSFTGPVLRCHPGVAAHTHRAAAALYGRPRRRCPPDSRATQGCDLSGLRSEGPQRLVVLCSEVGGRFNGDARGLLRDLVRARARAERRRHCELLQLQGGHDDGGAYFPSPYSKRSRAQPSAGRRMQPARQARPSTASSTWQRPRGRAACPCAQRRSRTCARPSFRRKGSRSRWSSVVLPCSGYWLERRCVKKKICGSEPIKNQPKDAKTEQNQIVYDSATPWVI